MFLNFWLVLLLLIQWKTNAEDVKCNFSRETLNHKYECRSRPNQLISLNVLSPDSIEMRCSGIYHADDLSIPDIRYSKHMADLSLYRCPIPKNGFQELFEKFHIESLVSFTFYKKVSNESLQMRHFQGLVTVQKLKLMYCNITYLDHNILKLTPRIQELDLSYNNLLLYDHQFQYASLLIYLDLYSNSITYLPERVFDGLKQLATINLKYNKIQSIDKNVFNDLINLKRVMLEFNSIIRIDIEAFKYQRNLDSVDFDNNKLGYISRNLFENCISLSKIRMSKNSNLVFENRAFSDLLYLILIELDNSGIQNLPEDIFFGSINLYSINLQSNKIKLLPKNIFEHLELLRELYLNNNEIAEIHDATFRSLKNLQILKLQHNLLSVVSKNLLMNSDNLQTLNISFNQIHSIDAGIFAKKQSLTHFLINNNRLNSVDSLSETMIDCKDIRILQFSNNRISWFPYALMNILLENAKYDMNMTPPQQTEISIGLILSLENNNITKININYSELDSSTSLFEYKIMVIVSKNPINCDCESLDLVLESRKAQDLKKPVIFDYRNVFCSDPPNLTNIPVTKVDVNKLICPLESKCTSQIECDCYYKTVTRTIIIDCSLRNLSYFPQLILNDVFEQFDLKFDKIELHMEDNKLEKGPTLDGNYWNVTGLYLQRNIINYMSWLPPNIEILNLDHNQLKSFDSDMINSLEKSNLRTLSASSNPWLCNCETKDFINYLWKNILKVSNASQIRCNEVEKALIYLNEEDICPLKTALTSIICSVILICFIICSATILVFYIYEKEVLIWLYARGSCLWLIKEERLDKNKKYDAFVSFAHQDEIFVMDRLVPILELGIPPFKLCVHVRDWIPGEYIATQISNSVRDSRRTLIILSPNFIKSVWGRMEFRAAHTSAMKEGRVRIILIIYGEVDMDQLDEELKAYIKTNTYIEWGDPWFWEKLRYALPRTRQRQRRNKTKKQTDQPENGIELH
ncbi:hypothetical protein WA026_023552 [Henosepilachna vigintioctopunctata]|uniref:TIR domain-containing protein n=1 Tax=Henosepilachna vigintioctopunctata TaxID=420089 RepID=A0AAW1USS8_9CUCU